MGLNANVLNNTLEFLRRVETKGLEAFAFVEAYTALQNEYAMVTNPQLKPQPQPQPLPLPSPPPTPWHNEEPPQPTPPWHNEETP